MRIASSADFPCSCWFTSDSLTRRMPRSSAVMRSVSSRTSFSRISSSDVAEKRDRADMGRDAQPSVSRSSLTARSMRSRWRDSGSDEDGREGWRRPLGGREGRGVMEKDTALGGREGVSGRERAVVEGREKAEGGRDMADIGREKAEMGRLVGVLDTLGCCDLRAKWTPAKRSSGSSNVAICMRDGGFWTGL
jgi:hypothetical protein